MKKIFTAVALIILASLIGFACKKSSTTNSSTSSTTTTTGNNATPVAYTFSVNGVAEQGSNPQLIKGGTPSNNEYSFSLFGDWNLGIAFSGTITPTAGNYLIEDSTSTIPAGYCTFVISGPNNQIGHAPSGTVTVATGSTNTINFSNILVPAQGTTVTPAPVYTVSGTIKY